MALEVTNRFVLDSDTTVGMFFDTEQEALDYLATPEGESSIWGSIRVYPVRFVKRVE